MADDRMDVTQARAGIEHHKGGRENRASHRRARESDVTYSPNAKRSISVGDECSKRRGGECSKRRDGDSPSDGRRYARRTLLRFSEKKNNNRARTILSRTKFKSFRIGIPLNGRASTAGSTVETLVAGTTILTFDIAFVRRWHNKCRLTGRRLQVAT